MKPLNKVWSKFEITKKDGTKVKLKIHDVTKDKLDVVNEFMRTFLFYDEPFMNAAGLKNNEKAVKEYLMVQRKLTEKNTAHALVCSIDREGDDDLEIVGAHIMYEDRGQIFKNPLTTKEAYQVVVMINKLRALYQPCKELEVPKYLASAGLSVVPDYRCCGIATEILKARVLLTKEVGSKMAGTFFTTTAAQIAAERAGFKTTFQISCKELGQMLDCEFENQTDICKFMMVLT